MEPTPEVEHFVGPENQEFLEKEIWDLETIMASGFMINFSWGFFNKELHPSIMKQKSLRFSTFLAKLYKFV